MRKRSGRNVQGAQIEYVQTRKGYRRRAFTERRQGPAYLVRASTARPTHERFTEVVEVPERARNARFYASPERLPEKYAHALQRVR